MSILYRTLLLAGWLGAMLSGGCAQDDERAESREPAVTLVADTARPERKPLYGSDAHAWLINDGNAGDSGHCAARLRLPLSREPSWEYSYSAAEFSSAPAQQILHYDGDLIIHAQSSQLLVLDALTGETRFNADMYVRGDEPQPQEYFLSMFVSPLGDVLAYDIDGRHYCFSLDSGQLKLRWHTEPRGEDARRPQVADTELMATAVDDELLVRSIADGAPAWSQVQTGSSLGGSGITLSRSGVVLHYIDMGVINAYQLADGKPLWAIQLGSGLQQVVVDDWHDAIVVVREDESLEYRALSDGALKWSHSWAELMSAQQRRERLTLVGGSLDQLDLVASACQPGPDGIALCIISGDVFFLTPDGDVRWHTVLDSAISSARLFDGALMTLQLYSEASSLSPHLIDYFNVTEPGWEVVKQYKHGSDSGPGQAMSRRNANRMRRPRGFGQVAVLATADGARLDSIELPAEPLGSLTPARDKIVLGGGRRHGAGREARGRYFIYAYDWLEPENN